MSKKSIEDVMNEIEDFLNSCKTSALSSNKIVVPRDEFDELFDDLKIKIPAEIERCKKIMRNKEAILMEARKKADALLAQTTAQANQMVSETEIMNMANQQAYETVEMARAQANEILAQATAEANEIRLGSMQYTNDIMTGLRDYMFATMEAERANYENLIGALNNEYMVANANLEEVQRQIVGFTGDPNSIQRAPQFKTSTEDKSEQASGRSKTSMVQKMKRAVSAKEEPAKANVTIPDFIASGEKVVPNETPLEPNVPVKAPVQEKTRTSAPSVSEKAEVDSAPTVAIPVEEVKREIAATNETVTSDETKKVTKKIVKKRMPVVQTPNTAQETVAKTVETAAAAKVDKTVYRANGEQAREVPPMEGRVKRGPRVGRSMVEESASVEDAFEITTQYMESVTAAPAGKSMGVIDDYTMEKKY